MALRVNGKEDGNYSIMGLPSVSVYPIIRVFGTWVMVIIVPLLGRYMMIRYLDPEGYIGVI